MCTIEKIKSAKPHDEFEFTCSHCGKKFKKTKTYLRQNKYRAPKFCSRECQKEWYKENCYTTVKCKECGNEFKIKKYIYNKNKTKHFFCNNSCAAKYNNKKRNRKTNGVTWVGENKKRGYNICPKCGERKLYTSVLCVRCSNEERSTRKYRTLGSYVQGKSHSNITCNDIRNDARKIMNNSKREKVCEYCHNHEFDDILEVHHIKGIMEFDYNTTIGEINDESNLVWLCPNHHKMLEMGLIKLDNNK